MRSNPTHHLFFYSNSKRTGKFIFYFQIESLRDKNSHFRNRLKLNVLPRIRYFRQNPHKDRKPLWHLSDRRVINLALKYR